jgi:hypothetical protein
VLPSGLSRGGGDARHQARQPHKPFRFDSPLVVTRSPSNHRSRDLLADHRIAEHSLVDALPHVTNNGSETAKTLAVAGP